MSSGAMIEKLEGILQGVLPQLLHEPGKWQSLIINRRKPYTYRVFTFLEDGTRISLHKFDPCDTHEAFLHPHPWPGAFKLLSGSYRMQLGHTPSLASIDGYETVASLVLTAGSSYEILNPNTWHNVIPLSTTYTVMINDAPWGEGVAHVDVRTTTGKDLETMPEAALQEHLLHFRDLLWYVPPKG